MKRRERLCCLALAALLALSWTAAGCGSSDEPTGFRATAVEELRLLEIAAEEMRLTINDSGSGRYWGRVAEQATEMASELDEAQDELAEIGAAPAEETDVELLLEALAACEEMLDQLSSLAAAAADEQAIELNEIERLEHGVDEAAELMEQVEEDLPGTATEGMLTLIDTVDDLRDPLAEFAPAEPGGEGVLVDPTWGDPIIGAAMAVDGFLQALVAGAYADAAAYLSAAIEQPAMQDHITVIDMGLLISYETYDASEPEPGIFRIGARFIGGESAVEAWYEVQPTELGYFITDYTFDFHY
ncbi:MAG: hypothetical protein ACYC55_05715 [Candidatus Geothermincolia bacterium]